MVILEIDLFMLLLGFFIAASAFVLIRIGQGLKDPRPVGLTIFGVLLIVGSLDKLFDFQDFAFYQLMFQGLPDWMVNIRYVLSVTLRFAGILCGMGILSLKNVYRRLGLFLCALTILTIYWKHPAFVFENLARNLEPGEAAFSPYFGFARLIFSLMDVGFAAGFLYYFTRRTVKEKFRT
jgi:hypothetical protein